MPRDFIFGAASGSAIVVVLGVLFANRILDQIIKSVDKGLESALKRAEEAHKQSLELLAGFDIDLRERRIKVYEELWQKMELLPIRPRADNVSYKELMGFNMALRDWYFQKGGIYLSRNTQKAFASLQGIIAEILKTKPSGILKDKDYDAIAGICSSLRTEMTTDILSRKAAPL